MALHLAQQFLRSRFDGDGRRAPVHRRQLFNLLDKPGIDLRQLTNFLRRPARRSMAVSSQWIRSGLGVANFSRSSESGVSDGARHGVLGSSERIPFCSASLKVRPNRHDFADRFHLRFRECYPRAGNFSNCHLGSSRRRNRSSVRSTRAFSS